MSRIQDERSAETRRRLLNATVDCLYERGYSGTTTAEIASRAGVSKGAQIHHYPTKETLVVSALEHLFELRLAASSDPNAMESLPRDRSHRFAAIVDMLVPVYRSKIFYSWLELVVASRTDTGLREAVRRVSDKYSERNLEIWKELFGAASDDPAEFRVVDSIVNGQFAAIAVSEILGRGEGDKAAVRETLETIKDIGISLLARASRSRRTS